MIDVKRGDILFVFGNKIIDEAIEEITHGPSHTAVVYDENKVIEAQGFRHVGFQDMSFYLPQKIKIYRLPNTQGNIDTGIQWLLQQFGRPYDYWDIFVLFVKFTFKLKIPWKEGKRILCSRLVRDYIARTKLNIPDNNMAPRDVEDWVIANGGVLVFEN